MTTKLDCEGDLDVITSVERLGTIALRIVVLCALVIALDGFDAQSIAYVAPGIAASWSLKPAAFGPVFSSGLVGLTIGAMLVAPLADRFGRKLIILISVFLFGLFSLLTAGSDGLSQLLLLRLATGIGLGGAMPNLVATTSEHAPARLRSTLVMLMFCGFPLGSVAAGLAAAPLMAHFGWPSIFFVGGVAPLMLLPLLWLTFEDGPGSVRRSIQSRFPLVALFQEGRAAITLLLWLAFFTNLLVMYFLVNWLPTLLKSAGLSMTIAVLSSTLLNLAGALGAVALGYVLDRFNPYWILGTTYASAAIAIAILASSGTSPGLLLSAAALAGVGIVGSQIGINAVCAQLYPSEIRATGVGWALGIGRVGSILGPLLGGVFLGWGWQPHSIVLSSAAPALVAALAVFALGWVVAHSRRTMP